MCRRARSDLFIARLACVRGPLPQVVNFRRIVTLLVVIRSSRRATTGHQDQQPDGDTEYLD
jgi:hypothetical protein